VLKSSLGSCKAAWSKHTQ
jgi:hypothetical protein